MEKIILTLFSFLPDHEKHFNIFEGKKISEKRYKQWFEEKYICCSAARWLLEMYREILFGVFIGRDYHNIYGISIHFEVMEIL